MKSKGAFNPCNRNLDAIFSNDHNNKIKYKYSIPDFQRQYSWTNKNLEELWKDLNEAFTQKEECYFMGSFVLVEKKEKDLINFDIIDGQQRFTTFVIMMYVLIYDFESKIKNNTVKKLKEYLQLESDNTALTLQSNPNYDSIFDKCIRARTNHTFSHEEIITDKLLKEDTPEHKYLNTAYFFYDHFFAYEKDLDEFIRFIFNNIYVIKTVCYDENFAIKMFISLNNRGLPLSNSDNFKSWLYSKCNKSYRNTFNSEWKSIVEKANDLHILMDDLIVWYEYFLLKNNPKLNVVDELKQKLENKNIKDIVIELKNFINCAEKVLNPRENTNLIYSLLYVKWKAYIMTALISALMVDYDNKSELFKLMRRFYYIAFIAGDNVNSVKNTSFKLIEYIVNKNNIDDIKELMDDYIYRKERIARVYRNINGDVYGEDYLKPLMLTLDYSLHEDNSITFQQLEKIHMDHILPKAYQNEKNGEWKYIRNHKQIEKCINSIGNMALLQWYKNIKALNKGFEKKIYLYSGYEEDGITPIEEEKGKGVTRFYTTQEIINDFKNKEKKWTSESIETRKKLMITRIEKLLSISENDKDINFDNDRTNLKSGKWLYKNNKYNNKQFVKQVLYDYLYDNKITEIENIPKDIVGYRLYFRDFISDKEGSYRYKIEVNGMNLYLCDVYYASETPKLIEIIKKHYDFEYEYIENTNLKIQHQVAERVLEKINDIFKNKYNFVNINKQKIKSYIQIANKKWLNDKIHFEIYTNTNDWNNKKIRGRIELHFEKSKSSKYIEFLNKSGFDVDRTLTPSTMVGKYNNKTISENIELNFADEESLNDTIDNIIDILIEYTNKYGELLDELANNHDITPISKNERPINYDKYKRK